MNRSTDSVVVTTLVDVDALAAFEVFTEQVDAWWKHGRRFRTGARGQSQMRFEPGLGGRLIEVFDQAADPFVLGRVTVWEPSKRLVFEMGGVDLAPGERTEVEVRFEAMSGATRVTVEHRGWDAFAESHPVRRGLDQEAFATMMGLFWGDLLLAHRHRAEETS
jgi:hypothetical protein